MRIVFGLLAAGLIITFRASDIEADEPVSPETARLLSTFMEELIEVTPGHGKFPATFTMGGNPDFPGEQPRREVELKHSFWMAKYEVPQNLYAAVMGVNPSRWKGPRNSVEMMTHSDAVAFCTKLTQLLRTQKLLTETEEIRLPSETEWEYCCRAGTETAYSFGDRARRPDDQGNQASLLDPYAWHTGNAAGNDPPVGALKPNPWGFYDMHGYLWEFCSDSWTPGSATEESPEPENNERQFVIRGGSWQEPYHRLRSATRAPFGERQRSQGVGIRCVRAKVPQTPRVE
jgi:formylglycine-generating enzyme required for sulfatase activity